MDLKKKNMKKRIRIFFRPNSTLRIFFLVASVFLFLVVLPGAVSSASFSWWRSPLIGVNKKKSNTSSSRARLFYIGGGNNQQQADHQKSSHNKKGESFAVVISKRCARLLYILTALNPGLAVLFNDYNRMLPDFFLRHKIPTRPQHRLAKTYETLFFFARLKPRVSFAIGAGLRALQMTTALQYVFNPVAGVGFGLNILCWYARSQWPATIVLGWALGNPFWKLLGACPPSSTPGVPITFVMRKEK